MARPIWTWPNTIAGSRQFNDAGTLGTDSRGAGEGAGPGPGERSAFLNRACSSDQSLRQEVETLLASSDDVRSSFLQSSTPRVTLTSGTKLGEYEVKSLIGSGGPLAREREIWEAEEVLTCLIHRN